MIGADQLRSAPALLKVWQLSHLSQGAALGLSVGSSMLLVAIVCVYSAVVALLAATATPLASAEGQRILP